MERKKSGQKRKAAAEDESEENETNDENENSADERDTEDDNKIAKKKAKKGDYLNKKLERRQQKREERKLKRKETKKENGKIPDVKTKEPCEKRQEDRFKLLRPPPESEDEDAEKVGSGNEEKVPDLVDSKAIDIDSLEVKTNIIASQK